jgi:hypothetical protein
VARVALSFFCHTIVYIPKTLEPLNAPTAAARLLSEPGFSGFKDLQESPQRHKNFYPQILHQVCGYTYFLKLSEFTDAHTLFARCLTSEVYSLSWKSLNPENPGSDNYSGNSGQSFTFTSNKETTQ